MRWQFSPSVVRSSTAVLSPNTSEVCSHDLYQSSLFSVLGFTVGSSTRLFLSALMSFYQFLCLCSALVTALDLSH
jgi:hypothetical protein